MSQLKHVQSTLGWCFVSAMSTYALINLIGFASPFWGLWRYPEDPYAWRSLLTFWQPITVWFSIFFVVAAWHLSKLVETIFARIAVLLVGALVMVAEIGAHFARRAADLAGSDERTLVLKSLNTIAGGYVGLAALVAIALLWRAVRQSNSSFKPSPHRQAVDLTDHQGVPA